MTAIPGAAGVLKRRSRSRGQTPGRGTLIAGSVLLFIIVGSCVLAPLLTSHDPVAQDLNAVLQGPSASHPLGTDSVGRDVFARILYGGRIDLQIAFLSVLGCFVIGTFLGVIVGYFGGWVEAIVMRVADVVASIPIIVILLAMVFVLGAKQSSLFIAVIMVGWVVYARIVRAEVLAVRDSEYVIAARASGLPVWRVLGRHVMPNVLGQALAFAMLDIVNVIALIVFAGYIGLGIQPPTPEWGAMIADGQTVLQTNWQLSTYPGVAIVLTGLAFVLVGDGLQDRWRNR